MNHHQFCPNDWELWMKKMFLDPISTLLDETQFRLDLFETTNDIIVEVCTETFHIKEIWIKCEKDRLYIKMDPGSDQERARSVQFPFDLSNHLITAKYEQDWLEIFIDKNPSNESICNEIKIRRNPR
ncbi:HSP20 family molecular chaperone IbpA [Oikeobacillus pervagus]|uniref:HSP20 family molecular chaperone IbpA n=1 Tax=Oikeobacillus pervagus TaxID=1325931 RepID=A0AAJ1T165_9BACI|nr:Hsp20/alpha crystallin family protein [Oikeobacillus pervagus]MDQ0214059.1 HSP20 family molecular chaperone IbpA [Oikeobacillus pervagus]